MKRQRIALLENTVSWRGLIFLLSLSLVSSAFNVARADLMNFAEAYAYTNGISGTTSVHDTIDHYGEGYQYSNSTYDPTIIPGGVSVWSHNQAKVAVDPVSRIIKSRTYAENEGPGGTGLGGFYPFAMSYAVGYFANQYRIDPGSSGLKTGDLVELLLNQQVDGTVTTYIPPGGDKTPKHDLESGWRVFRVDNPDAITVDGFLQGRYAELLDPEIGPIVPDPGLAIGPRLGAPSVPVPVGVGLPTLQANVGDSIFVENYFMIYGSLNGLNPVDGYIVVVDYWNTVTSTISGAVGYEGLQLTPQMLVGSAPTPVPVPSAFCLLALGLASLAGFRSKLKAD